MKCDGRERPHSACHHGSGGVNKYVSLLRLLEDLRKRGTPRISLISRPARGKSVSPPCDLTSVFQVGSEDAKYSSWFPRLVWTAHVHGRFDRGGIKVAGGSGVWACIHYLRTRLANRVRLSWVVGIW